MLPSSLMENNIDEINSLSHDLTAAKFEAYYLYKICFNILSDHLTGRKQRLNPLSVNLTKWSNTLKQFIGFYRRIVLSVFDHFVALVLTWLRLK